MSLLNRRNAVASLPVMALPAVAIAAAVPPDPIFAAIDAHKQAAAAFSALFVGPEFDAAADAEASRLCDICSDAALDMLETVPTTLAGAAALVRHIADREKGGEEIMLLYVGEDGHGYDELISSLASSLSKLAVQS